MKTYPFKFLDAYEKEDRDIFFGREEEVAELYRLVFQTNLLLIYGASGTGKTSLIRCGLANRFKSSQWLDLYIRRGVDMNSSLLDTIRKRQPETQSNTLIPQGEEPDWFSNLMEADEKDRAIDTAAASVHSDNPVAQALHELYLATFTPIYLVFDQFEELYTLGTREEQQQLTHTIAELVQLALPVKIIIVMREEYLARLYDLEKAVPQLRNKKLRIEPMDLPGVQQVILNATALNPQSNIELEAGKEADIARAIIDKVREDDVYVKLPYLQVFMDRLYEKATDEVVDRSAEAHFTLNLVSNMGNIGDVLADFIELQSARLQRKLSQNYRDLPGDIVWQILSPFATVDGTKVPIRQSELPRIKQGLSLPDNAQTDKLIRETVAELENSRILRYRKEEDTYEVAHDTLALQIAEKRSEEEKTYLKARRMVTEGYTTFQDTQTYLNREQLAFVHPYEERLEKEMETKQWAFLHESERQVKKKERRRRLVTAVTGTILLIAAGVAIWFAADANKQAVIAEQEKENALIAQQRSDTLARVAEGERLLALDAKAAADTAKIKAEASEAAAQDALSSLQNATATIVLEVMADAAVDIYHLRYEEALSKYDNARQTGLNAKARTVWIKGMMELVFFFNEIARENPARRGMAEDLADRLAKEVQISRPRENTSAEIETMLKKIDPAWYNSLLRRYYPYMLEVGGGIMDITAVDFGGDTIVNFRLAQTETTIWQYNLYCEASGQDSMTRIKPEVSWGLDGDNPVIMVNCFDAAKYANWLNKRQGLDAVYVFDEAGNIDSIRTDVTHSYRLPKDSEWEYAARGGPGQQVFDYSGSDDLASVGWYYENSQSRTRPVAQLAPTRKGDLELYDMSGNVWEWCDNDWGSLLRSFRGGSWRNNAVDARVVYRHISYPDDRSYSIGFRLARPVR